MFFFILVLLYIISNLANPVVSSDTTQIMAIIADIMLVYIPAPTVSFQPPLARNAGAIASFFHNCPDNAFQVN